MYSAASKGIWEVFERKTRLFFWFFPPSFLFLKKTSKHIARSLLLLPWKGCIFVLLFTFVHLILVFELLLVEDHFFLS